MELTKEIALVLAKDPTYCLSDEFGVTTSCTSCPIHGELCNELTIKYDYAYKVRALAVQYLLANGYECEAMELLL